ncbi:MAG: hypothetical protein ACKORY_13010 [Actinomycetota bacterium]
MTLTAQLDDPHTAATWCGHPSHHLPHRRRARTDALVRTLVETGPGRALVNEWDSMNRRRSVLRTANGWGLVDWPVESLDDLLVAAGFGQATDDSDGDHILWHLSVLAETDDLAARIVLQRILPPLFAIAKRRGRITPGGTPAALDDVLAVSWMVIKTYPHMRRPAKVAANLARDAEYAAFVRPARLRRVLEIPTDLDGAGTPRGESSVPVDLEIALVLDEAESRGVASEHIELLRLFARGLNSGAIALQSNWSARTIRNRRRIAIDEVRRALADD